ncbi:MAG: type II toxin-antitoxin system RelE/ParE family toxin [Nitrososphaera sp.]
MKAEFHPEAEEEFIEASLFYDLELLGLGEGFISEVQRVTKLLVEKPEIGARIDEIFRRILLNRFPYSLIYSLEPERIWIVAVAHQRRRPGYWRSRIER